MAEQIRGRTSIRVSLMHLVALTLLLVGFVPTTRAAELHQSMTPSALPSPTTTLVQRGTFDVQGRINNGTAQASVPTSLELKIVAFLDSDIRGNWDVVFNEDGSYSASGIPRYDGVTYVLATNYQDVPYLAQIVPPDDGSPANQDMLIFESTPTDPGLTFDQSALIVTDVDESARAVTVTELHTVVNPTDKTFAPSMGGPGGPSGLLVFGMPPSSFDFTPGRGLDPSELVEIGLGFASLSPIYPGRKEISFSYRFPYSGTQAAFNRTIRYPVDSVRVLAKTPGPDINSTVLVATESATIGGQPYRILGGGPLNPGTTLAFTVDNLPIPGGIFGMIPPAVPAAAGALVGVALMVLYWRHTRQQAAPVSAALETDDLIDRLVALDIDRNAGRLGETEYQREREALLAAHAGTATAASPSDPAAKES